MRDVAHAAAPVEHLTAIEIVKERVDREVAPDRVLVRFAEDVVAADEDVLVERLPVVVGGLALGAAPEGRDLDDLAALEQDVREAEAASDDAAVAEQALHVLGTRARRDVEVLRFARQEEVADAAPYEVGLEPGAVLPKVME